MEALSSSFISAFPKHSVIFSQHSSPSYSPLLISCVSIEDKPQTLTSPPPPITTNDAATTTIETPPPSPRPQFAKSPPRQSEVSLTAKVLTAVEDLVSFIDPPRRPSVDPRHVLCGNFAPVNELMPTVCEIVSTTGRIPPCLDGAYIRNGPNPQFLPKSPYHLFDGDGMLHCLHISECGAHATFSSRYVRTNKFKAERQAGTPVVPNIFAAFTSLPTSVARLLPFAARAAAGQFNQLEGIGLANTSLTMIGGRLFALGESDLPYEVAVTCDGDIVTVGRCDFDDKLSINMTAHPKLDPVTRETFAFRYGLTAPFLTYFRFDADGNKIGPDVPVPFVTRATFLHDFAISNKYAIFVDNQIGLDVVGALWGGLRIGADPLRVPRVGMIPRYANEGSEIRWLDVPGLNPVHTINAWDEIDPDTGSESIVLVAPNIISVEHTLERMELIHSQVEKVRINLQTSHVSRVPVSSRNLDFAVINPKYVGRKNRYVYAGVGDPVPKISGVVKLDLGVEEGERMECMVAERMFGDGCYGGEPFFIARDPEDEEAEEDDGYVVSYVHDEGSSKSKFVVMDARSPQLEVVAEVRLPRRVPYGFHGMFVREKELRNI